MIAHIKKRDGSVVDYDRMRIENAIFKAINEVGGKNARATAKKIAVSVEEECIVYFQNTVPGVEDIQDKVERTMVNAGLDKAAEAYIVYRALRKIDRANRDYLSLNAQVIMRRDGFFQLDKDKEALSFYLQEIDSKTIKFKSVHDRLKYLIDNDFYEDFYKIYSKTQISKAHSILTAAKFEFASYMAASKFYKNYALKTPDKNRYLESYEDRILATALHLSNGSEQQLYDLCHIMITQQYQPATPTFLDAGKKKRGELVSCFLTEMEDSLNSITHNLSTSMYLSKIGGGVALNLSNLRARGETIKGIHNAAKGVVPVLKLLEDGFNYADKMGQRKGAGAAYLNIFHADVEEFLDTKKINADEKSRIQSLSLGLTVPQKFFELARDNAEYYVFYPYTVKNAFGTNLDEMDMQAMYDKLVAHPDVRKKKLDARNMLNTIAKTQFESGYPYIVYIDNANQQHALKDIGRIKMSNLCTEIFQLQIPSVINDYDTSDELGRDISCVLGSLNIVNMMQYNDFERTIEVATRALTQVASTMHTPNAPTIQLANQDFCAIGLGAMNLHGYLAKNMIPYDSQEARDFVNTFFMMVNFYSIKASMKIAKEKNKTFKGFENSEYAKGIYFEKYINNSFEPITDRVQQLFGDIKIVGTQDWQALRDEVQKYGLFNAYRLTIAPTQSISYVQNSTPSIMPIIDHIETRTYADSTTYYPMPYLSKDNIHIYDTAYFIDNYKILDLVAAAQQHVDQGISTILYVTSDASTRDLAKLYIYANKIGLKSLYYTRVKNFTVDECVTCAV